MKILKFHWYMFKAACAFYREINWKLRREGLRPVFYKMSPSELLTIEEVRCEEEREKENRDIFLRNAVEIIY